MVVFQRLQAQTDPEVLVIDSKQDISVPAQKLIKEIRIQKKTIHVVFSEPKTKEELLQQCLDSVRHYGGNCFKISYYEGDGLILYKKGKEMLDIIRGTIYILDEQEFQEIRTKIESYSSPKEKREWPKELYETSLVFQFGGESQLALFMPKFNFVRKYPSKLATPYIGAEAGIHAVMVTGLGSFGVLAGLEKNIFNVETSLSHFRVWRYKKDSVNFRGPFRTNFWNIKVGVRIKSVRIKIGRSIILSEYIPRAQERIGYVGQINNAIWGVEVQIK